MPVKIGDEVYWYEDMGGPENGPEGPTLQSAEVVALGADFATVQVGPEPEDTKDLKVSWLEFPISLSQEEINLIRFSLRLAAAIGREMALGTAGRLENLIQHLKEEGFY